MNNRPPLQEEGGSPGWANWFTQIFQCLPWKKGINVTATVDFPLVAAQSEQPLAVTVTGARAGDAVQVTPSFNTVGILYSGVVTADNTVTLYAKNFTAGAINPASQQFRIIVLQN